jgi:N6-adenosine-specific RNA methylase IME4
MDLITYSTARLPANVEELQRFILIGDDALIAHQAKIRAISKLTDAQAAKEAAIKDGQSVGEAVLWAKAKLGEMLQEIEPKPKPDGSGRGTFGGREPSLPSGITKKQSHYYQQIHNNRDIVEQVIADAIEHEDLPTTQEALKRIQRKNQQRQYENKISVIPPGKFRTIVIDPPWPIEKILREERPYQDRFDYQRMSLEEIGNIPVPDKADEACHLYLWVTHKHLPKGFEILARWGFKYQCLLTWVKNVGFTPFSWMYSTEHILFARKGSLDLLVKGQRLDFQAKVREHSRKPDEFYNLVKLVSPEPRADWFAREKRDGFVPIGNETAKFQ